MLESVLPRSLLVVAVAALCALAPAAQASIWGSADEALDDAWQALPDPAQSVGGDALTLLPHTGTRLDGLLPGTEPSATDDAPDAEDADAADESAPDGQADESGTDGDAEDEDAKDTAQDALDDALASRPVQRTLTVAATAVDTATALLPDDPVSFLDENVRPLRQGVEEAFAPDAYEVEEAPLATATISSVDRSTLSPQVLAASAGAAAVAAALLAFWMAGSSGSLGAAAAVPTAPSLRKLLPFASPLFTRFEKDTVLGHPKREALYALILQDPGVSLQSLCDATGLSRTAVTHHLRLLEMQHLIVSKRLGRSRHYYENGGRFGRDQKEAYAVLHNDRTRDVARFVRDHPGAIQKALCDGLGIQPSIAHWHLRRLLQARLVEAVRQGRTVAYRACANLPTLDGPALLALPEPNELAPAPMPALVALPARATLA